MGIADHSADKRTRGVLRVLAVCLVVSTSLATAKVVYGFVFQSLAFTADGIHSYFDSGATILGMISVYFGGMPPDEGHPYGHRKFEMVSSMGLAFLLFLVAYEVGSSAVSRVLDPNAVPQFSVYGILIIFAAMGINLSVAWWEARAAKEYDSHFLRADSFHNQSDFFVSLAVMGSLVAAYFRLPILDGVISLVIAVYLVFLSMRILWLNFKPLVDTSVLDPKRVGEIVRTTEGVMYCHSIRSRGEEGHHYLDLNIHLPGEITLYKAHEITHRVESRLKGAFPGLVDVIIHTEPHNHPPCSRDG